MKPAMSHAKSSARDNMRKICAAAGAHSIPRPGFFAETARVHSGSAPALPKSGGLTPALWGEGILAPVAVRHAAQRRRIRTVMHELMFKAARMVHHARQWVLGLGANDTAFAVFERHWRALDSA